LNVQKKFRCSRTRERQRHFAVCLVNYVKWNSLVFTCLILIEVEKSLAEVKYNFVA